MGLCRIMEWQTSKTVKLSDSYRVRIKINPDDDYIDLPECTNVSLPTYKYKEETYDYGNNSKKFIIPDYTGLEDLSLELLERYDTDKENNPLYIQNLVNIFLNKLFDQEHFAYRLDDYISELKVTIYRNTDFNAPVLEYGFYELKLTDYSKYELDYTAADLTKWNLKFSYRSYTVDLPQRESNKVYEAEETEVMTEQSQPIDREAMYNAMMEARKVGDRGVSTPQENEKMARRREQAMQDEYKEKMDQLETLKATKVKKPTGADAEQKNLQEAQNRADSSQAAVDTAKEELNELRRQRAMISDTVISKQAELSNAQAARMGMFDVAGNAHLSTAAGELDYANRRETERQEELDRKIKAKEAEIVELQKTANDAWREQDIAENAFEIKKAKNNTLLKNEQVHKEKIEKLESEIADMVDVHSTVVGQMEKFGKDMQDYETLDTNTRERHTGYKIMAEHSDNVFTENRVKEASLKNDAMNDMMSEVVSLNRQNTVGEETYRERTSNAEQMGRDVRREQSTVNVLGELERPEMAGLEDLDIEPKKNNLNELEHAGTANRKQEGTKITVIDNTAEVYRSKEFNDRVLAISMENYDAKKGDAQRVYEQAQRQAMDEYLAGKLKIKK